MAAVQLSVLRFFKFHNLWRHCRTNLVVGSTLNADGFAREISVSAGLLGTTNRTDSGLAEGTAADKNAALELRFGRIFDKKPVRVVLEEGKLYSWCTCGQSKKQPFCDNSHRAFNEANPDKSLPPFRSHKFEVDKKKEYALCNCKQTKNRPFCDGTHKQKFIQDAVLSH